MRTRIAALLAAGLILVAGLTVRALTTGAFAKYAGVALEGGDEGGHLGAALHPPE